MNKDQIIDILRNDLQYIQKNFGVKSIGLFGSFAKDEQHLDSDIDFLVDVTEPLVSNYFGLWTYLENKFDKKIDLIRKGPHLREKFLNTIEREIIYA